MRKQRHAGCVYELQSAQRLAESFLIDLVHTRISGDNQSHDDLSDSDDEDDNSDTKSEILQTAGQATFATVTCVFGVPQANARRYKVVWHSCTDLQLLRLPTALLKFVTDHFGHSVTLATEYVRHIYTFQCHPAYQSDGAIYDWMNVKFSDNSICPC